MILSEKQIEIYNNCMFLSESSDEVNRRNTYKTIYSMIRSRLLPKLEDLEFHASINQSSYSVEFWTHIDGKRKQSYQLEDEGFYTEKEHKEACKRIVDFIKTTKEYKLNKEKIYKLRFTWPEKK